MRNIHAGCIQINLGYQGHAFDSLQEALDPAHNVANAAQLLKSLYRDAALMEHGPLTPTPGRRGWRGSNTTSEASLGGGTARRL